MPSSEGLFRVKIDDAIVSDVNYYTLIESRKILCVLSFSQNRKTWSLIIHRSFL